MKDIEIKKVDFLYENQPSRRKIKVTLSNKTKVYIEPCHESWEQYGGVVDELRITMPVAKKYNKWLHGGKR
jgi:hypothetical protein